MLSLPRQHMRRNLSDISQRDRGKLVGVAERSRERMFFTHLLRIEEGVLGVEAGAGESVGTNNRRDQSILVEKHTGSQRGNAQSRYSHHPSRQAAAAPGQ